MKRLLIALSALFFAEAASAQAMSVQAELGGPGLASLNFDTRFTNKSNGIGGRIGIGGFSVKDGDNKTSLLTIPVQINYLIGENTKNYFEVGAGGTYVSFKEKYATDKSTFEESFGHLWLGYRLQPLEKGFVFRAGICPIFNKNGFIPYYAGISFGYRFK